MTLSKGKIVALLTLCLGMLAGGAALAVQNAVVAAHQEVRETDTPRTADREPGPTEAAPPRTDLYGDLLPPGALARMGTVRLRHGDMVFGVAFSGDGKTVASASNDGTVRLWEAATGREQGRFRIAPAVALGVVFSGDGHTLGTLGSDGAIYLWELKSEVRMEVRRFGGEPLVPINCFAISPDGKLAAGGWYDKGNRDSFVHGGGVAVDEFGER